MNAALNQTVQDFRSGDREAFAELVRSHQHLVTSVAFANLGDLQRSEDIAQRTFLLAWQKQQELSSPEKFGAWVCAIARNLCRNHRRRIEHRKSASLSNENLLPDDTTSQVSDTLSQREQSDLLWATLGRIPVEYREPMVLFYRQQKSIKDVAELLGLSEANVKQRLSRGRKMLKVEIEQLVEQSLAASTPSDIFAASVIAALPATGKVIGSATAKVGASALAKTAGGKLSAGLSALTAGGLMGILGGLIGLLAGIAGAWFGVRSGAREATSEDEKRLIWRYFYVVTALSVIYTVMIVLGVVAKLWPMPVTVGINIGFVLLLLAMTLVFVHRQRRLHAIHGKPASYRRPYQSAKPASITASRWNSIGMLVGVWAWVLILAAIAQQFWLLAAGAAALIALISYSWIAAPGQRTMSSQMRFNGRLGLYAMLSQATILTAFSGVLTARAEQLLQGIPLWAVGLGITAFGVVLWQFCEYQAKNLDANEAAKP